MLLELPKQDLMTVGEVVEELRVSPATVRNWIKTGYLKSHNGKHISRNTFEDFCDEIIGAEKLIKRANKSKFDDHDHNKLKNSILARLSSASPKQQEELGQEYEESLSNAYKNKEGIYYTPPNIVARFFEFLPNDVANMKFCDPCCGTGNFIIAALDYGFLPENIYGYDIDPIAVEIARARFKSRTGLNGHNIINHDFLTTNQSNASDQRNTLYDVILTNPPWGKKLDPATKKNLASFYKISGSLDTASLFFYAAIKRSPIDGIVGMLLPDSFFNISTFTETRKTALDLKILGCVDFGKAFKGLLTKAKGIIVQNTEAEPAKNYVICDTWSGKHLRSQAEFIKNPKFILNFACSEAESKVINQIYSFPHVTLANNARWGLGIVTGNNNKFIVDSPQIGYVPVYKGSDISKGKLKNPANYIPNNMDLYQQVASPEIYCANEKLVYRFISSKLVFYYDTNRALFLNSANMLVLRDGFEIDVSKIAWLFNTEIMSWLFEKLFETHKVLRSDLELLPIFSNFFNDSNDLTEENLLSYLKISRTENGTYRAEE